MQRDSAIVEPTEPPDETVQIVNTIVHISDLHFGREKKSLLDPLLCIIADQEPQLVVVSGDLTQRARKGEFLAARAFLSKIPFTRLIISGNHDVPAYNLFDRFYDPWRKWHRYAEYELEPLVSGRGFVGVGINTARRSGSLFDWSRGRVNEDQAERIEENLAGQQKDTLRLVAAHHPFWLPRKYKHRRIVGGRDMAMISMKRAGVDLILSGHVHSAYTHVYDGVIISHAGTAISDRLDRGDTNSFKILHGDRNRLTIETWIWQGTSFNRELLQKYSRGQDGWSLVS